MESLKISNRVSVNDGVRRSMAICPHGSGR